MSQASYHHDNDAATGRKAPATNYALVDLTASVVRAFPFAEPQTLSGSFGASRRGAPVLTLGVGDVIQVSLFESSAGGLFVPADAGSRPGNYITLPSQTIEADGTLSIPYAGNVPAVGRTAVQVQEDIQSRLADRAIEPQAVITLVESRSSVVSVLGDVNSPSRFQINPAGERILDAISRAGGLNAPGSETNITLQRNQTTATVLFDRLVASPNENIFVYPGDLVYANRDRRTFLAFGATGLSGRIDFEETNLTLAEGVGRSGGLLDGRADPGQVFLYRLVPPETLATLGIPMSVKDTAHFAKGYPVIFRVNMRDPSAYFLAQQMPMVDKDIIYVTNADSVEITKFLSIINTVSSGTVGPIADTATGRDAINAIRR